MALNGSRPSRYSPTMQAALKTALIMRDHDYISGGGILRVHTTGTNTVVALLDRGALVRLGSKAWGVTRRGAEVVGIDYDQLLVELHMQALAENERFRRCPFAAADCDFVAFGKPSTPFGNHREITSDDQIIYHVNQRHMPMSSAHRLSSITAIDDEVRTDVRAFIGAYEKAMAYVPPADDERITDVEQARTAALYEYIERAKVTPGEHSLMTTMPKRQALAHAVDIPLRGAHHCERTDAHTPHVWSHLGPEPTWYCDGTFQLPSTEEMDQGEADERGELHRNRFAAPAHRELAAHLPELHGPIADGHGDPVAAEAATFLTATLGDEGWLSGRYAIVSDAGHHPRWAA